MNGHPLVHIILEIGLDTVQNFDLLAASGRAVCIREGLHDAVICNGNGGMPPLDRLFDDRFGVAQRVHHGHLGMEMQLNAFFGRSIRTAFRLGNLIDTVGLEDQFSVKAVQIQSALHLQALANLDSVDDGLGLFPLHEFVDSDGVCVVGHVKANHPCFPFGKFLVLHVEHGAFHQNAAHVQLQFIHGHRFFLAVDLTVDLLDFAFFLVGFRIFRTHDLTANGFHLRKDVILFFGLDGSFRGRFSLCGHGRIYGDLGPIQTERPDEYILRLLQNLSWHLRTNGANEHGPLGLDHAHLYRICTKNSQNPFREGAIGKGLLKGRQSDALHMYTLLAYRVSINFINSGTSRSSGTLATISPCLNSTPSP